MTIDNLKKEYQSLNPDDLQNWQYVYSDKSSKEELQKMIDELKILINEFKLCPTGAGGQHPNCICGEDKIYNTQTKSCDDKPKEIPSVLVNETIIGEDITDEEDKETSDGSQCPNKNPRLSTLNSSHKVGDFCSYGNVESGKVFKYKSGTNTGTCSCTALSCKSGYELSKGSCILKTPEKSDKDIKCPTDANVSNGVCKCKDTSKSFDVINQQCTKMVFDKVCDKNSKSSNCIQLFEYKHTNLHMGIALAQLWGFKNNKNMACKASSETRGVLAIAGGGDDYIQCTSGGQAYEFRFGDLKEAWDTTRYESDIDAICKVYGYSSVKSSKDIYYCSGNVSETTCNTIKNQLIPTRTSYKAEYMSGKCMIGSIISSNKEEALDGLKKIDGVDNNKFQGQQLLFSEAKKRIELYLKQVIPSAKKIYCNNTFTTVKGSWFGQLAGDDIVRCFVDTKPVDMVFDDMSESGKYERARSGAAMDCLNNTPNAKYEGKSCRGITQEECSNLNKVLLENKQKGAQWNSKTRSCYMQDAVDKSNKDAVQDLAIGAVVVAGSTVCIVVSFGTCTPLAAIAVGAIIDVAIVTGLEVNKHMDETKSVRRSNIFLEEAKKCNNATCAEKVILDNWARLQDVKSDTDPNLLKDIVKEIDRLGLMIIQKDGESRLKFIQEGSDLRIIDKIGNYTDIIIITVGIATGIGTGVALAKGAARTATTVANNADNTALAIIKNTDDAVKTGNKIDDAVKVGIKTAADIPDAAKLAGYPAKYAQYLDENVIVIIKNQDGTFTLFNQGEILGTGISKSGINKVLKAYKEMKIVGDDISTIADDAARVANKIDDIPKAGNKVDDIPKAGNKVDDAANAGKNIAKTKAEKIAAAEKSGDLGYHGTDANISSDDLIRASRNTSDALGEVGYGIAKDYKNAEIYAIRRLIENQNPGLKISFVKQGNVLLIKSSENLKLTNKTGYVYKTAKDSGVKWTKLGNSSNGTFDAAKMPNSVEILEKSAFNLDDLIKNGSIKFDGGLTANKVDDAARVANKIDDAANAGKKYSAGSKTRNGILKISKKDDDFLLKAIEKQNTGTLSKTEQVKAIEMMNKYFNEDSVVSYGMEMREKLLSILSSDLNIIDNLLSNNAPSSAFSDFTETIIENLSKDYGLSGKIKIQVNDLGSRGYAMYHDGMIYILIQK